MRISDWSSDVCSSDLENLELFDADDSGRRVTKPLLALDDATLLVDRPGIHAPGRRLLALDMETSVDRQIVILRYVDAIKSVAASSRGVEFWTELQASPCEAVDQFILRTRSGGPTSEIQPVKRTSDTVSWL